MKNIIFITFLFLLNSCGYTAVYKDIGKQDFQITVKEMQGDRDMNNLIKNELYLYSNKNSVEIYDIVLNTVYKKVIFAKNAAGVATNYQMSVKSTFTLFSNNKSYTFTFNEARNIKTENNSFEQNLYEKNVKRNFASSLREKLLSKILEL